MAKIEVISKWNLDNNAWNNSYNGLNRGRSFAFANYIDANLNCTNIDYVIFASGTRVEDWSSDYININDKKLRMDKWIAFFKNTNKNICLKQFLMDADAPILEDAKLLARIIDSLSIMPNTRSINIVGHSKCGAMAFNMPKYFKQISSFSKTNIYTVATPFIGTKMASPKIFYPELKQIISSKLGKTYISNFVYKELIAFYSKISSNSHMDYDIAKLGGIPDDKLNVYDRTLVENMFSSDNLKSITRLKCYKNLVTGIDNKTLSEAIKTLNFTGIGLCIINDLFFDERSDGMVEVSSQKIIDDKIPNMKSYIIPSSHHAIYSNDRVLSDILHIVNDTIDEQEEHLSYVKKISK